MFALTVTLVVTAALSLSFASTRRIGIAAIALLTFLFPHLALVLLLIGGGAAAYFHHRKRR